MAKYIVKKAFKKGVEYYNKFRVVDIEVLDREMFLRVKYGYLRELDPKNPKLLRKGVPVSPGFIERAIKHGQRVESVFEQPKGEEVLDDKGNIKNSNDKSKKNKKDKRYR